ncbi:MAG: L-2-amino-thiazoline-4-carboxylic acid hydrolase [Chloroflexi bacterium]|nr:L-2-amino-thiazoline-4-carboxylic acid hydrolase [Chloroflexota bacterium]
MNAQTVQRPSIPKLVRRYFAVWRGEIAKERGEALAIEVMANVQTRFESLYADRPRFPHPSLQMHLGDNILPVLALYQALREQIQDKQMALKSTEHLYHSAWEQRQKQFQWVGRFPFIFQFIRLRVRQIMNRDFPPEGWGIEWAEVSSRTVAFNVHRCFYLDMLTSYGAPELTSIFCGIDDFMYENFSPHTRWGRTKTLGRGDNCCDFRFSHATPWPKS